MHASTVEDGLTGEPLWLKIGGLSVARITIEDCLDKVDNRFQLVHMAAKRVRQIREGSEYLVSSPKNEDIVVALREVAAGKVVVKEETDEPEMIEAAPEVEAIEEETAVAEEEAAAEPEEEKEA
jgi:DNA-directed RNA polymerase subunit omega